MATQVPGGGSTGQHAQMFELAKKLFAEQQTFLNQEKRLSEAAQLLMRGRWISSDDSHAAIGRELTGREGWIKAAPHATAAPGTSATLRPDENADFDICVSSRLS